MAIHDGGLDVRFAFDSRRVRLVAGASLVAVPGASADRRTATELLRGIQRNEKERSDLSAESPGTGAER